MGGLGGKGSVGAWEEGVHGWPGYGECIEHYGYWIANTELANSELLHNALS